MSKLVEMYSKETMTDDVGGFSSPHAHHRHRSAGSETGFDTIAKRKGKHMIQVLRALCEGLRGFMRLFVFPQRSCFQRHRLPQFPLTREHWAMMTVIQKALHLHPLKLCLYRQSFRFAFIPNPTMNGPLD